MGVAPCTRVPLAAAPPPPQPATRAPPRPAHLPRAARRPPAQPSTTLHRPPPPCLPLRSPSSPLPLPSALPPSANRAHRHGPATRVRARLALDRRLTPPATRSSRASSTAGHHCSAHARLPRSHHALTAPLRPPEHYPRRLSHPPCARPRTSAASRARATCAALRSHHPQYVEQQRTLLYAIQKCREAQPDCAI